MPFRLLQSMNRALLDYPTAFYGSIMRAPYYWVQLWLIILFIWVALFSPKLANAVDICSTNPPDITCCNNQSTTCAKPVIGNWEFYYYSRNDGSGVSGGPFSSAHIAAEAVISNGVITGCPANLIDEANFTSLDYPGYGSATQVSCTYGTYSSFGNWSLGFEYQQKQCANYEVEMCGATPPRTVYRSYPIHRYRVVNCPDGYQPDNFAIDASGTFTAARVCYKRNAAQFYLTAPHKPQCGGDLGKGNPCNPATGEKFQAETDIRLPLSGLAFTRYYSSHGMGENPAGMGVNWSHSFAQRLDRFYAAQAQTPGTPTSSMYAGRDAACSSGWNDIKAQAFGGAFQGATATYTAGLCQVSLNGVTVTLEIHSTEGAVYSAESSGYANPDDEWHTVERPNGVRYLFRNQGGRWNPDASGVGVAWTDGLWVEQNHRPVKLARPDANTWRFTDEDGTVEAYDRDGNIQTATDRAGRKTTYAYLNGKLDHVTDPFGRVLRFAYDATGQLLQSVTGPDGAVSYQYDASNRLSTVVYPDDTPADSTDNLRRTYHYEKTALPHHLTGITDENGQRYATWDYDGLGRAILSTHAGDADKINFAYNANGTTTLTNALGGTQTYRYAVAGDGVRFGGVVDGAAPAVLCPACGDSQNHDLKYDANGNVTERRDFRGNGTCYQYDGAGRNLETVRVEGFGPAEDCPADPAAYAIPANGAKRKFTTEWHPTERLPTRIAGPRRLTLFHYQGDAGVDCGGTGRVLCDTSQQSTKDTSGTNGFAAIPQGKVRAWRYAYNAQGQLLSIDGPRTGNVADITTLAYYPLNATCPAGTDGNGCQGALKTATNALGHTTSYQNHDANGRPRRIVDPNGLVTDLLYDRRGRLTQKTVDGNATLYGYDGVGNLIKTTLPTLAYYTYTYDAAHRLTDIADSANRRIHYTLDAAGNRTQEDTYNANNALAATHRREYDNLGRLFQDFRRADDQTERALQFGYDANANTATLTEPLDAANDRVTTWTYDALDRPTRRAVAAGGKLETTGFGYDALDHLIKVTDANGQITSYVYDGLDNLTGATSPNTGTTAYAYDEAGNLTAHTAALNAANGTGLKTSTRQYDALDRPTSIGFGDPANLDIAYTYDPAGGLGRLGTVAQGGASTGYGYDLRGNVTAIAAQRPGYDIAHDWIGYAYNGLDQVVQVDFGQPAERKVYYERNTLGQITRVRLNQNGVTQTLAVGFSYRPLGPLSALTYGNGLTYKRTYNLDDRVTDVDVPGVVDSHYGYDAYRVDLVASITDPALHAGGAWGLGYDAPGDRLTTAQGDFGVLAYGYDGVGNRLNETRDGLATLYGYDPASQRLLGLGQGGTTLKSYGYDANGNAIAQGGLAFDFGTDNRLRRVRSGGQEVARYAYDGQGRRITKTVGGVARQFYYGRDGGLLRETGPDGDRIHLSADGTPLALVNDGTVYYLHPDRLGTVQRITDAAKQVVWSARYEPFGQAAIASGIEYNPRFPGQYYDAETGLYYNHFRDYDAGVGRYVESDPVGLGGGVNTYAYVGDNPLNWFDSKGLDGEHARDWARSQVGKPGYGYFDPNSESLGRIQRFINGRKSLKCNKFVWDALSAGGDPAGRMPDGRIPSAYEWWDPNVKIPGYVMLPIGVPPQPGDVVGDGSHVGIYDPLPDGSSGTNSAAAPFNGGAGPNGGVVHNNWGFREDSKNIRVRRCECDIWGAGLDGTGRI